MDELDGLLREALRKVTADLKKPELATINGSTDVFHSIDSFSIVDLMLETEMRLEQQLGRYVALADETIFDAEASPLLKWSNWVAHVERRCAVS